MMRKLLWAAALLAATCVQPAVLWAEAAPEAAAEADPRAAAVLGQGWRFRYGDAPADVTDAAFDDSAWQPVSVPHSWNHLGEYALSRSADANGAQGVGWYRLAYDAPAAAPGKRFYLDFAGVGAIADVWVNGRHMGQHKGAFSRFRIDVTAAWQPGARNIVAVKADNSKPAVGSSTENVIPLAGDFFIHGGIYRPVSLITANDVGIDLLDFGGPGVYLSGFDEELSGLVGNSLITMKVRLRNAGPKARKLRWSATLRDAEGHVVQPMNQAQPVSPYAGKLRVAGGGTGEVQQILRYPHLRRWNGTADPYFYSLSVEVRDGARLIDRVTQPVGVRWVKVDPARGFFLNPSPWDRDKGHIKLHGVSRHQDRQDKGWALTPADHAEDMALIREMGANSVRQAHYQHADDWSDLADRNGIIVWAELPYVTTPSLIGGQGSPELWANAEQQLRELIRQNYNHPAIAMWSVGNEVDAAKGFGVIDGEPAKPLALLRHLNDLAHQEDPTRPTTFADCCEDVGMMQTAGEPLIGTADLAGVNRYFGWYMPKPLEARAQFGAHLDMLHAKHPTVPLSISEYGAGGAISQHSDDLRAGFVNMIGRPQPEDFQSLIQEETWPVIRERDYVFASWVWNMFDFTSDLRQEGDSVDINTKGLVTFDRKVKKDAFYYYKAQWNPEPMLHLTAKRHVDRAYPVITVQAYSNAERATLAVNGAVIAEAPCPDRICIWQGVPLRPGANQVTVRARLGTAELSDSAVWNGPDPARGLRLDAGDSISRPLGGTLFGSDTFVSGGAAVPLNMGGFGSKRSAPKVVSAPLPELYEHWREGEAFAYALPLPDGKWTVTLHTFEPRSAASADLRMTVKANGAVALPAFNVAQAAGGALKGLARSFPVTVKGGVLRLDFSAEGGKAVVAAIEVSR